jgi:rhodanese-related sulfurtransferase
MLHRRAFCTLAAGLPLWAQEDKPKRVDIDDLKQRHDKGENLFYLDVREPKELEADGALRGYVNIPIGQLESRLKEVPKDRTIVVY